MSIRYKTKAWKRFVKNLQLCYNKLNHIPEDMT